MDALRDRELPETKLSPDFKLEATQQGGQVSPSAMLLMFLRTAS